MADLIRHRGVLGHEKIVYLIEENKKGDYNNKIDGEWIWCCD